MKTGIDRNVESSKLFGPEMLEDPYSVYQALRETDPVHWDAALSAWVLTRYDDVAWVLNDPRFSSDRVSKVRTKYPPSLQPLFDLLGQVMLQRDEPDHKRLRNLVHTAFMHAAVDQWEDVVQGRVDALLTSASESGRLNFITDFAVPLPVRVISEIMGIPDSDRKDVKQWCDDFSMVATNFYANISDEKLQRGLQSVEQFANYLSGRIETLRRSPGSDLLSSLIHVQDEVGLLTPEELVANSLFLLTAGNETTTNLLGNGLAALLKSPDQLALLKSDLSLVPNAVEELLRYDSPVQFLGRVAMEDTPLGTKTIRQGELVMVVFAAANRDPARFSEPDRLDVTRQDNHHLAFGHGRHFCAGAQLARMEANVAFKSLISRFEHIQLETTELAHRENFNLRCLQELPLIVST